jgi:shikimate dehydrogenase
MTEPCRFALIGEKVEYSRSPHIFKAIFEHTGCEGSFEVYSVALDGLRDQIKQVIADGITGFSVTIPHKQSVIEFLDDIDSAARSVEAVNSVLIKDGRLTGFNTDVTGVTASLKRAGFGGSGQTALILGSGGSARAVIYALHHDFGIDQLVVCGRTEANLQHLKQHFSTTCQAVTIKTVTEISDLPSDSLAASIIVNCTPLGGANLVDSSPLPEPFDWSQAGFYFDLNYNEANQVVRDAQKNGIVAVDGSAMLVAQAVKSFELWTGQKIDFEPIYNKVFPGQD